MLIASTFTIGKLALQYLEPIFLIGSRMIISGLLLLGYLIFVAKKTIKFSKTELLDFASIILFHIYIAFVAEFIALKYLSSVKVCLLYNLSPFISALFSYFYFSEVMTRKKLLGLAIGFAAFIPTFFLNGESDASMRFFGVITLAELLMITSVISVSYGWIIMRRLIRKNYSVIGVNGIGMLGGGILATITSFFVEGTPALKSVHSSATMDFFAIAGYMTLAIIIANIVFYNLYGYLLHKYTATFLSFAGFITPLFAAVYGWVLLGETVDWSFFFTVAFVVIGLYLFYQEELRQGYIAT